MASVLVPSFTSGQNIWLEPECGNTGANWLVKSDDQASKQSYLTYELNDNLSNPPISANDQVRITFSVAQAGTYKVWARVKAPQDGGDSFWFKVDDDSWVKWRKIPKGSNFIWVKVIDSDNNDAEVSPNLTTGLHTITIGYRETKTQLDKLYLTLENAQPQGIGSPADNCNNSSQIWVEAECANVGENWLTFDEEDASQEQAVLMNQAERLTSPSNDPKDKLTFQVNVPEAGNYQLSGRLSATDNETNSLWVKPNGDSWIKWDNIGSSSANVTQLQNNIDIENLPIIPGAQGFGINSAGGRGGKVIKVTNLKGSGAGSLRACVEASGPRVCVFEVSGIIEINDKLVIKNPYITIAGQTAPDPGVMIYGDGTVIKTHNVLVQHLGFRPGDADYRGNEIGTHDCISLTKGSDKVVLDHLSLSWGSDENLSIYGDVGEVTIRNLLISDALNIREHAFGGLMYGEGTISMSGTLFANLDQRQPKSQIGKLLYYNNLHYNRGLRYLQFSNTKSPNGRSQNTVMGNVFVEGPSRRADIRPLMFSPGDIGDQTSMYLEANYWKNSINSPSNVNDQWDLVRDEGKNADPKVNKPPIWISGLKVMKDEQQIIDYVLENAGSRPAKRMYLDQKIIDEYKSGKGKIIDCVTGCSNNAGGEPKMAQNKVTHNLPSNMNGDDDGDGYTNLEEWLHQKAAQVEGSGTGPIDPDPGSGGSPTLVGQFSWHKLTDNNKQDNVVSLNLQAGTNTIEIAHRESGIIVDKLYLSKDNALPSGLGGNAYNCGLNSGSPLSIARINAGGVTYNSSAGKTFQADTYYSQNSSTSAYNSNIGETQDVALYKTERRGTSFGYDIPMENGTYDIRLKFAELQWLESGKRRFNVKVEGATLLNDLDIFASSGFGIAVDKELLGVQVQDGTLNIDFQALAGEAQICAIEVLPGGSLSNSSNTPPSFTISGDILLSKDFEGIKTVEVFPDPVSIEEADQKVTYSLSPAFSLISNITIDEASGQVQVKALAGVTGSE
ncbi:MAG: malectin domain-containing carbohydrate-binding protein, partial [Bacteroidota bacterium]